METTQQERDSEREWVTKLAATAPYSHGFAHIYAGLLKDADSAEAALALIRELAESDPTTDDDDGSRYCVLCGARAQARSERDANERWVLKLPPMTHTDHCLWLRARKMAGL